MFRREPSFSNAAHDIINSPTEKEKILQYEFYEVSAAETGQKTFMDYRKITNTASAQLATQQTAWTDEYGFRRYESYYLVAMGTYYAKECGKKFEIKLDNGTVLSVMIGDVKQDKIVQASY